MAGQGGPRPPRRLHRVTTTLMGASNGLPRPLHTHTYTHTQERERESERESERERETDRRRAVQAAAAPQQHTSVTSVRLSLPNEVALTAGARDAPSERASKGEQEGEQKSEQESLGEGSFRARSKGDCW